MHGGKALYTTAPAGWYVTLPPMAAVAFVPWALARRLAASIKLLPVIFLPWLIWRRRWRGAGFFVAGCALFALLLPGLFVGPAEVGVLYRQWFNLVVRPSAAGNSGAAYEQLQNPMIFK